MAAPKKPKSMRNAKSKGEPIGSVRMAATPRDANRNGSAVPIAEMIRLRAYELFLARRGGSGNEVLDWLTAEREIMAKFGSRVSHE